MTGDNGKECAEHKTISQMVGIDFFLSVGSNVVLKYRFNVFCHLLKWFTLFLSV
jgi:hypothetical protein